MLPEILAPSDWRPKCEQHCVRALAWHSGGFGPPQQTRNTARYRCLISADLRSIENRIMNDEKWIVSDKDHLGGKPRVQGTRISVAFVLECLASGMSVAEIVDAYPTLTENAVQGALRELAHEKEGAA